MADGDERLLLAAGRAHFVGDLPCPEGTVHLRVIRSPVPSGKLLGVSLLPSASTHATTGILTARDIPGENRLGPILQDEELLASERVVYRGQPVAVVGASSPEWADAAASAAKVSVERDEAVFDPMVALQRGSYVTPLMVVGPEAPISRTSRKEDISFELEVYTPGQEHLYLETQSALALPADRGRVKIICASQSPAAVQRAVARILGVDMNMVEVEVPRLGGGFGGKEDQATPLAAMAALAVWSWRRPARLVYSRGEDISFTGKRHRYKTVISVAASKHGRLKAAEVTYYQDAGAFADLSPAVMERSLLHASGPYAVGRLRATGHCLKTNLPPNTAFRGFGAPQAMFAAEAMIRELSIRSGKPVWEVQRGNLLKEGHRFHYGAVLTDARGVECWEALFNRFRIVEEAEKVERFNKREKRWKRGIWVIPLCFGISFSFTPLNQGTAAVLVYTDGSVAISTGAVEMGQGLRRKLTVIASRSLGIDESLIFVDSTSTARIPNMSPTAASTCIDLNGMALHQACLQIKRRLLRLASKLAGPGVDISGGWVICGGKKVMSWKELVGLAYLERVSLSAMAHYKTAGIGYDQQSGRGRPFAYYVFGAAAVRVTLDTLLGTYDVDWVKVVHDAGASLDETVDRGQVEGAVVQGLGWVLLEEFPYDSFGAAVFSSMATYKVPDITFAPKVEVEFLKGSYNRKAVMGSKGIGEPPFVYGIGGYFALLSALDAAGVRTSGRYVAPLTPERVLWLMEHRGNFQLPW